jgi:hypothetical protein
LFATWITIDDSSPPVRTLSQPDSTAKPKMSTIPQPVYACPNTNTTPLSTIAGHAVRNSGASRRASRPRRVSSVYAAMPCSSQPRKKYSSAADCNGTSSTISSAGPANRDQPTQLASPAGSSVEVATTTDRPYDTRQVTIAGIAQVSSHLQRSRPSTEDSVPGCRRWMTIAASRISGRKIAITASAAARSAVSSVKIRSVPDGSLTSGRSSPVETNHASISANIRPVMTKKPPAMMASVPTIKCHQRIAAVRAIRWYGVPGGGPVNHGLRCCGQSPGGWYCGYGGYCGAGPWYCGGYGAGYDCG